MTAQQKARQGSPYRACTRDLGAVFAAEQRLHSGGAAFTAARTEHRLLTTTSRAHTDDHGSVLLSAVSPRHLCGGLPGRRGAPTPGKAQVYHGHYDTLRCRSAILTRRRDAVLA